MTIDEVLKEITSTPKYYIGIMPQSTAARIGIAIRRHTAKPATIKRFFNSFGYEGEFNQWYCNVKVQ